jgi:hypothetical protein
MSTKGRGSGNFEQSVEGQAVKVILASTGDLDQFNQTSR